ncbi:hypothetical protein V2J09_015631 [Rumex salicifolius]
MTNWESSSWAITLMFLAMAVVARGDGLEHGFYNGKCGYTDVERLVFNIVKTKMETNKGLVGDLTRLSFHDCFVRGCDASVMLNGPNSEKTAPPNLDLDGFDDIDDIKKELESACPGVVSCADILVLATRSTIYLAQGKWYDVETGRRDGLVSIAEEAFNVPGPNIPMTDAIRELANIGLNVYDLVVLLGAHTVGIVHCNNFQDRLYNFNNTGRPDPTMDPSLVEALKPTCPPNQDGTKSQTFLDQTPGSGDTFDRGFYNQIIANRAVIKFDQRMAFDYRTGGIVRFLANDPYFADKFGQAMIKMTKIGVLTGNNGEVRKTCSAMTNRGNSPWVITLMFLAMAVIAQGNGLTWGFYNGKCGDADVEQLIFNIVKTKMETNKGLVGDLTRLSFHDCFVRGCDASVMLDGPNSEKTAPPNLDLDGFDDIDDIKAELEATCPGIVSCADILVLATRSTIFLAHGKWYKVETGRRDGLVSIAEEAFNVPGPNIPMTDAIREFKNIGLNIHDLVVLLGAHTVGVVHCNNF